MRLFVYGTLKEEARLAALVGGITTWQYRGEATVAGRLYDVGPYPGLRLSRSRGERVRGLMIEFADGHAALARLDAYEQVDAGLYRRRRCRARLLTTGRSVDAWVYVYSRPVRGFKRIVDGHAP